VCCGASEIALNFLTNIEVQSRCIFINLNGCKYSSPKTLIF